MTILFIDDEGHVLQSIKRSLYRWFKDKDFNAHFSSNSKEALEYVKNNYQDIGVIITDQQMPDLSGSKLLNIVANRYPDIIFVILSGHSTFEDFDDFVKVGITSFISKPWDKERLKEEIIKSVNLYKLKKENNELKKRLNNELEIAKEFQRSLLEIEGLDKLPFKFNITYIPSPVSGVSGDYYDLLKIDNHRYLILLGDVSGHGIKPAFITITLKNIMQHQFFKSDNFSSSLDFMKWLNNRVYELLGRLNDLFLSFSLILLNLDERSIEIVNAGQPPIIIKRDNAYITVDSNNMVLGIEKDKEFISSKYKIIDNDEILILSDGIHPSGIKNGDNKEYLNIIKNIDLSNHTELVSKIGANFKKQDLDDDKTLITIII